MTPSGPSVNSGKLLLLAALCIFLHATPPVAADRDVPSTNYFARLRAKRAARRSSYKQQTYADGNDDQAARIRIRPKRQTRASLLARSFVLAAIFWTVKFLLPGMSQWISRLCRDISKFKRVLEARAKEMRRRRRSRRERSVQDDESTMASSGAWSSSGGAPSISPSVMEILDFVEDGDGDGSFISSSSSFTSRLSSLGSFMVPRRRRSFTSSVAEVPPSVSSTKNGYHKSSKPTSSRSSKRRTEEEQNSLPKYLNLIDEESACHEPKEKREPPQDVKKATSEEKRNKDNISHLWGTVVDAQRKHGHKSTRKQQHQSPLERKLSNNSNSSRTEAVANGKPHRETNGKSHRKLPGREEHRSSKSNRQHRHRLD